MGRSLQRRSLTHSTKKDSRTSKETCTDSQRTVQLSSSSLSVKCDENEKDEKDNFYGEDRISELPDAILVLILSWLTFKEATITSILSCRWRYLSTLITSNLNFDIGKPFGDQAFYEEEFFKREDKYVAMFVAWVNQVLKKHKGTEVDLFRVSFSLDETYTSSIDSWVEFAMEKRVKRFELNLTSFTGCGQYLTYSFPNIEKLKPHLSFSHLVSLCLVYVDVCEKGLQYFLVECPLLEQLCVVWSTTLLNLKIAGESLKLKYLDLFRCQQMNNLEISAPNLVSFTYTGPNTKVPFTNVPLLSELCLGDDYCHYFIFEASGHSSYLSQIEKLTLIIPPKAISTRFPLNLPTIFNLRQLELRIPIRRDYPLFCFTALIKAAPLLSKFVIKLAICDVLLPERCGRSELRTSGKRQRKGTRHSHPCLKEIEFVGFVGYETDYEFALHLLQIAVSLEKFTIDTRHPSYMWAPDLVCDAFEHKEAEDRQSAKERALHLRSKLPAGADLVIV